MFYTDFRCYLARGPAFTPPITLLELIVRPCCGRLDFGIATEQFSRPPHIGSVTQLRPHGVWLPAQQQPLHLKNQSHGSGRKINHWHLPLFYSPRAIPIGCYSTVTIPLPWSCHHMSGASCHVDYIHTYYDFFLFPSCHLLSLYHPLSSFILLCPHPLIPGILSTTDSPTWNLHQGLAESAMASARQPFVPSAPAGPWPTWPAWDADVVNDWMCDHLEARGC